MITNRLINPTKYLTQLGQWEHRLANNLYGETSATTITTIPIYVYEETIDNTQPTANVTTERRFYGVIPSSVFAVALDNILQITDGQGQVVLDRAQVQHVTEFNDWLAGSRFKQLYLVIP